MFLTFLVVASFVPAFCYAVFSVTAKRFSVFQAFLFFFIALAAIFCASLLQIFLDSFIPAASGFVNTFFSSFIKTAIIEELVKLGFVWFIYTQNSKKIPQFLYSGALIFALFFSAFETVAYGISSPSVIGLRTFTSLPLHGASTVLAASALLPHNFRKMHRFLPLLIAILGHGLFTFSMEMGGILIIFGYVSLLGLVVAAFWYTRVVTQVYTELERSQ